MAPLVSIWGLTYGAGRGAELMELGRAPVRKDPGDLNSTGRDGEKRGPYTAQGLGFHVEVPKLVLIISRLF